MSVTLFILAAAATTATSAPAAPAPVDPLDRVKCVREEITGSLVSSRKVCHTEREWRVIRGTAEQEARRITQPGTPYQSN